MEHEADHKQPKSHEGFDKETLGFAHVPILQPVSLEQQPLSRDGLAVGGLVKDGLKFPAAPGFSGVLAVSAMRSLGRNPAETLGALATVRFVT
jgi:hypothetical protein